MNNKNMYNMSHKVGTVDNPVYVVSQKALVADAEHNQTATYGSTSSPGSNRTTVGTKIDSDDGSINKVGSVLSCHKISYEVKVKTKACCGNLEPKQILKDIE